MAAGWLSPWVVLLLASCFDDEGPGRNIVDPPVLHSRDGVLRLTLMQAPARIMVAGATFTSNVFNGDFIPPVLRLRRGDRLEPELVNRFAAADVQIDGPQPRIIQYHGMLVAPSPPGDDVFRDIGADFAYRWKVPSNHQQGTTGTPACARPGRAHVSALSFEIQRLEGS